MLHPSFSLPLSISLSLSLYPYISLSLSLCLYISLSLSLYLSLSLHLALSLSVSIYLSRSPSAPSVAPSPTPSLPTSLLACLPPFLPCSAPPSLPPSPPPPPCASAIPLPVPKTRLYFGLHSDQHLACLIAVAPKMSSCICLCELRRAFTSPQTKPVITQNASTHLSPICVLVSTHNKEQHL